MEIALKNLIIFAGAGASRGVSGEKYPMALDFKKRLPDAITSSPLYMQLHHHLSAKGLGENIDIEHILWELGQLFNVVEEWTTNDRFATALLLNNQVGQITQQVHIPGGTVFTQFESLKNITRALQEAINERVYDYYSKPPDQEELKRSWLPLLDVVETANFGCVDIVTTNYDLVIESVLQAKAIGSISMGFSQGLFPGIDLSAWKNAPRSQGMLTKLHGSVDWKLGNGGTDSDPVIRRGHPEFDGDHRKRLILYPGFKGVPTKEPFVAFHDYFRKRIKEASHLLFIGFAFRDDHINELIKLNLSADSRIAVVNPSNDLPALSFLKSAKHFKQGFGMNPKPTSVLSGGGVTPLSMSDISSWLM
jgi:hypothetical protein